MTMTKTAPEDVRDSLMELEDLADAADDLETKCRALTMASSRRECAAIAQQLRATANLVRASPTATETARAYIEASAERLASIAARVGSCAHA